MNHYTGEIIWMAGNYAPPSEYMLCNGAMLPMSEYETLFTVLEYRYGGAGQMFAIPDLTGQALLPASSMPFGAFWICTRGVLPTQ